MTIPQAFELALSRHQAGRLAEAEALYRQILGAQPNHADALHLLGVIALQAGRHEIAVEWIHKAILLNPNHPAAHSNLGEACRRMGRLDEAIAAFRRALELKPDSPETHNNLGVALKAQGHLDNAISSYRQALKLKPGHPDAHNNLGNALSGKGQIDEAIAAYRRAIELRPDYPEAHNNLGAELAAQDRFTEAITAYHQALKFKPDYPEAYLNLGDALKNLGQFDEAIAAYRRAVEFRPGCLDAHVNLAGALKNGGQLGEAAAAFRRAIELKPDHWEVWNNLGVTLAAQSQWDEAIAAYRRALQLQPDFPEALNNLGNALKDCGQLDEAIAEYRRALQIKPDFPDALASLGNALKDQGELDEAAASFRRALQRQPASARWHSALIHTLHFNPAHDAASISAEHQRWDEQFGDPAQQSFVLHANDRSPGRRLRVGYVSPDFRDHPVGRYITPLFEHHDREEFEILCYSGALRPDWMTERLRALAGEWRNTAGVSDARLTDMIREDCVDILVDLTMHTAGNRLPVFARRPAPVQVTWLAYPGSPGLRGIGYRLTDAHMDPPGEGAPWSTEEPVRLPDCWCCYQPAGDSPEINALPASSSGRVTFGSLNNFAKVNERVMALWTRILQAVKESRLLMLCPEGRARERVRTFFGARGLKADRLELTGFLSRSDYLNLYQRIDLALDPFPCNGMTTTCDALWMGTPALTLPGAMPVSRAGLSLLSSVGLTEFVASSEEDYLRMAVAHSSDLPRLAKLRAALRPRMLASPLMDAPRFARNVEAAYRSIWQAWCLHE
jgi:protein O-GlcNAc transferase